MPRHGFLPASIRTMDTLQTLMQPITRSRVFLEECWAELKKVHFPTTRDTYRATIAVVFVVMLVALYLSAVDLAVSWIIRRVLS